MFNNSNSMLRFLFAFTVVKIGSTCCGDSFRINDHTVALFVPAETGQKLLGMPDDFMRSLSPLERQLRLQSSDPISQDEFQEFAAKQAIEWKQNEIAMVKSILKDFSKLTSDLRLPLPTQVQFVRTTGKEEGGAAYCRGTAVVIPTQLLARNPKSIGKTVKHELFHVISNQNPKLRDEMYKIIGFRRCEGFKYPDSLLARRLTNPDAPRLEHYIELRSNDAKVRKAIPILYSNREKYEGGSFFDYLRFSLQVIELKDGKAQPALQDGKPFLLDPNTEPDYARQIGNNTRYIIHPEEILADNFVKMIEKAEVPNPEILESLRSFFEVQATADEK